MKITVVTSDFSHNCLLRAYILAKMLQREFEVELIGPILGTGVWSPLAEDISVPRRFNRVGRGLKWFAQLNQLYEKIDGDVVYASKPLLTSFGVSLKKKLSDQIPLILDIDDWEWGYVKADFQNLSHRNQLVFLARYFWGPSALITYANGLLALGASRLPDRITVSSNFLQRKFGGQVVYHAVDTAFFDPDRFDRQSIRSKYNIKESAKIVMFSGTPRPHKGVDDLIAAISIIDDIDVKLVVVGLDDSEYSVNLIRKANEMLGRRFVGLPMQPFERAPELLSIADVVAIPQRRSPASIGQIPAKVFNAMAMGKPVIATNVSDLEQIVGGCGWIVEPNDPRQLAGAIEDALKHPQELEEKGERARDKCVKTYSMDSVGRKLVSLVKSLDKRNPCCATEEE